MSVTRSRRWPSQKMTDQHIEQINEALKKKEGEILEV